MPVLPRWILSLACFTAFVAVCSSRPTQVTQAADPPRNSPSVTIYDPNPKHLWNRLHEALYVRLEGEEPDEPGELDPFLWQQSPYREKGEGYNHAVAVLDEFIAERGDKLIADPRKRALLQRDLWVLFDSVASVKPDHEVELASRVARILPRLALTAEQIKQLPDNFTEAAAAKKFPDGFDAGRLWDADGPWVLLGTADKVPLARTHVEFFGGRSAFFVFLRMPEGREQIRKIVDELRANGTAAKIPWSDGFFALVRQMQLIDDSGKITLTPIVETLQIRGLGDHELKLSRQDFMAGKPSLRAVGPEDRERDYLTLMGRNVGVGRSAILNTCVRCHSPPTLQSYVRLFPPWQSIHPTLTLSDRNEEATRARVWKASRYEWGLMQGLSRNSAKE